jgi:hypothetical protein
MAGGGGLINKDEAMKTIEEKVEIYRAYLNGKTIQWMPLDGQSNFEWEDIRFPAFDYEESDYRVKPEPPNQKVAYAFVSVGGYLEWNVNGQHSAGYERASEFDIIANNKDQK